MKFNYLSIVKHRVKFQILGNIFVEGIATQAYDDFVVVKDVSLRSADIGVYPGRAIGAMAEEELPDKPAATEGTKEAAPCRSQRFNHYSSFPKVGYTNLLTPGQRPFYTLRWC